MAASLPTGPRGRLLALGMTLALAGAAWVGVAAPLLDLHAERAARLEARRVLAERMEALAASLPDLRRRAAAVGGEPASRILLEGETDALAAAALQGRLEEMARAAGASLSSAEALAAEPAGAYRRIGLRLAVAAPWPPLVELLRAIAGDARRLLLDDLQVQPAPALPGPGARPLNASFTVFGFRAEAPRP